MCGIAAIRRFDGIGVDGEALDRMACTVMHRGPDDADVYIEGGVGLGHRRLSILDLSPAGRQPMRNEDGSVWLICNGEIYNFVELAGELRARGHEFRSRSDSEVILHLYEELQERCVDHLNGMFAFVLWDSRRRVLLAARDRLGIKTLHYHHTEERLLLASEVKSILAEGSVPRVADARTLTDYLFCGYPLEGRTGFQNVRELPAGHRIIADENGARIEPYWRLLHRYDRARTDSELHAEATALIEDSIRIHGRSDAAVGCHLSGGLDSGLVTAVSAKHRPGLHTFSIRFAEGGYFDESPQARAAASLLGTHHHEAMPDARDFVSLFPSLLWHLELPMMTFGGYSYFTVSRLAAAHVKVALTGHGGDEVFAGYAAQFKAALGTTAPFDGLVQAPVARLGKWSRVAGLLARARRKGVRGLVESAKGRMAGSARSLEDEWVALHCMSVPRLRGLLAADFRSSLAGYDPREPFIQVLHEPDTDEALDRVLYHDLRSYLPGLLYMEDRLSMSVSLESRVPLLDHRLVELLATVPPEQKVRGMRPKAVLRAAAERLVPEEVLAGAAKRPFPVPLLGWLQGELAPWARKLIADERTLDRGVLNADRLREDDLTPVELWKALNIEMWHRVHVDDPVSRPVLEAMNGGVGEALAATP